MRRSMLQLIYTSAPKLLESGKSGFGTVAQSRQLPQVLKGQLERISAFDRDARVDSYLLYSTHQFGQNRYHIFSRIGNSGTDYTLRTNHTAHHWVVTEADIQTTGWISSTPAALMFALRHCWQNSWNQAPQWIEAESPLPAVATMNGNSWSRFTGNSATAHWLAMPEFADGAYLVCAEARSDDDLLSLLHEAMLERADKGWGMGYATAMTSTISRNLCPFVCVGEAQYAAGILPGIHARVLHVAPMLEAPERPAVVEPSLVTNPGPADLPHLEPAYTSPAVSIPAPPAVNETVSNNGGHQHYIPAMLVVGAMILAFVLWPGEKEPAPTPVPKEQSNPKEKADAPKPQEDKPMQRPEESEQKGNKPAGKLSPETTTPDPKNPEVQASDSDKEAEQGISLEPNQFMLRLDGRSGWETRVTFKEDKEAFSINISGVVVSREEFYACKEDLKEKCIYFEGTEITTELALTAVDFSEPLPEAAAACLQQYRQAEREAAAAQHMWEELKTHAGAAEFQNKEQYLKAIQEAGKASNAERVKALEEQLKKHARRFEFLDCEKKCEQCKAEWENTLKNETDNIQSLYKKYTVVIFDYQIKGIKAEISRYDIKYIPPAQKK